jgi:hypothetical protein
MKLDQLRKIIREEVRAAVKEELQEVMNEAVKIASTPQTESFKKFNEYKPVKQKDLGRTWSTGKMNQGTVPLEEMINQTASAMTKEDYSGLMGTPGAAAPNLASSMASTMGMTSNGQQPGLDISQLDFVKSAKGILDASMKKDKHRGL